ncbi:alpha/beta hydrolase [Blastococcus jejuensis]|uniref:Alpha/beta hydrolase n=1 Tax=Blastococcus jejuensis TaxID=351224 RepID=A0ABP6P6V2_9ACTN
MTNYVLVHGGFVGGWYWQEVADLMRSHGHRVEVIEQLPSAGPEPAALGDLAADADLVRSVVAAVGEPVVLVGHSYGGMVVTELADDPAVAHVVYLSAFWPQRGQSVDDFLGGQLPDWIVPHPDGTVTVTEDLDVARKALCADIDATTAAANLRRFVPQSVSSLQAASTGPERTHPATYIICEQDNAIPPAAQEQMSSGADHVERLDSSHQAMGSMPASLAALLERTS